MAVEGFAATQYSRRIATPIMGNGPELLAAKSLNRLGSIQRRPGAIAHNGNRSTGFPPELSREAGMSPFDPKRT
jgi:hypothetical protein